MVRSGAAVRGAVFRENMDHPLASKEQPPRQYLIIFESNHQDMLRSKEFVGIPGMDVFLPSSKGGEHVDARNYNLIQNYDPKSLADSQYLNC